MLAYAQYSTSFTMQLQLACHVPRHSTARTKEIFSDFSRLSDSTAKSAQQLHPQLSSQLCVPADL